jgi:hypothetical protein
MGCGYDLRRREQIESTHGEDCIHVSSAFMYECKMLYFCIADMQARLQEAIASVTMNR